MKEKKEKSFMKNTDNKQKLRLKQKKKEENYEKENGQFNMFNRFHDNLDLISSRVVSLVERFRNLYKNLISLGGVFLMVSNRFTVCVNEKVLLTLSPRWCIRKGILGYMLHRG